MVNYNKQLVFGEKTQRTLSGEVDIKNNYNTMSGFQSPDLVINDNNDNNIINLKDMILSQSTINTDHPLSEV